MGTAAAACVLLCAEAGALLATVGGGAVVTGSLVRDYNYAETPGPHSIVGYVRESVIGGIENGPFPIERLFGGGEGGGEG